MTTVLAFIASYLTVWALAGIAVYALYRPHGTAVAGAIVIAAGVYELTPVKVRFRRRCHESQGSGWAYALSCVGSSAGLMLAWIALGVMSLLWMSLVAVLVIAQKFLPARAALDVPLALAIIAFGVLIRPSRLLPFPGSPCRPDVRSSKQVQREQEETLLASKTDDEAEDPCTSCSRRGPLRSSSSGRHARSCGCAVTTNTAVSGRPRKPAGRQPPRAPGKTTENRSIAGTPSCTGRSLPYTSTQPTCMLRAFCAASSPSSRGGEVVIVLSGSVMRLA